MTHSLLRRILGRTPLILIIVLVCVAWTIPTIGVLVSSLRPQMAIRGSGWWTVFGSLFEEGQWTLSNYGRVLGSDGMGNAFLNSVLVTIPSVVIPITIAAFAAYAFGWMDFAGRKVLFFIVIALMVVALAICLIRLLGEVLIAGTIEILWWQVARFTFGTEVLFDRVIRPLLVQLSEALVPGTFAHGLLIGALVDGEVDFMRSFGVLTSGLFIPLGIVLPYLLSFYFVISLLEDIGYLPRLALFLDSLMRRFGLHGYRRATLEQIGDEIGVTRERVRQIQLDALKNLRQMMESNGISGDNLLD